MTDTIAAEELAAARATAIRLTKNGIPGPKRRLQNRDGTWGTFREGRARFLGRLGDENGSPRAVVAWCPWCDYDGTEVAEGPDFGQRLDAAISAHLDGCAGFAGSLAEALAA